MEIADLRDDQKREFHNWVYRVYEDTKVNKSASYMLVTRLMFIIEYLMWDVLCTYFSISNSQ